MLLRPAPKLSRLLMIFPNSAGAEMHDEATRCGAADAQCFGFAREQCRSKQRAERGLCAVAESDCGSARVHPEQPFDREFSFELVGRRGTLHACPPFLHP